MGVVEIGRLSMDASVKIHYSGRFSSTKTSKSGNGGIQGYIHHIDRGTDRMNGIEQQHSNLDIDSEHTLLNESYFKDASGNWQPTNQSKDMVDAVNNRIDYAKNNGARISTKGKNDTVIVRPLLLQLDADTIKDKENWMWDIISILEWYFNKKNIVGFSVHRDETNVHLHICFTPVYESQKNGKIKCSISQNKFFFSSPRQLAGLHKKIRKALIQRGYDIELDNKPIDEWLCSYTDKNGKVHQQGLTPDFLKELSEKELNLSRKELEMSLRQNELDALTKTVTELQKKINAKQEEMEKEREILSVQQMTVENDKATVQAQLQALITEKINVQKMRDEAEQMLADAKTANEKSGKILAEDKKLNVRFLEFVGSEGRKVGKPYRRMLENWFERFKEDRRNNTAAWVDEAIQARIKYPQDKNAVDNSPNIITDTGYDF